MKCTPFHFAPNKAFLSGNFHYDEFINAFRVYKIKHVYINIHEIILMFFSF